MDWRQLKEELLCKGGIAESGLQMPHVHVLLVTPLGACDMAQAGADEHQGGVAIREGTHDLRLRISRFRRSMTLFVRIRVQCSGGKSQ